VLLLEIRPMITFVRWRIRLGRGERVDASVASALYVHNHIELAIVVVMVFVASLMARGVGS
jgi:putative membrane protein